LAVSSTRPEALKLFSTYGPVPTEFASSQLVAVSVFDAFAASVPPCASTCLASVIPMAGLVSTYGSAGSGVDVVITTVDGFGAVTEVTPSIR